MDTGPAGGAWNMAVDEALLAAQSPGASPVLRFYSWVPPAVSLGYFQVPGKEIDFGGLGKIGATWVRRATGGRAVLHDDEVTYAVVIREELLPGTVIETYRVLSEALVAGLRALGVPATVIPHSEVDRRGGASAACFDAPSWYEVVSDGRKLVGSAQVRRNGAILQHGSIPLSFDVDRLLSTLRVGSGPSRERVARVLRAKAAGLAEVLGQRPSPEAVREAIVSGFESVLGVTFVASGLTPQENEAARLLAAGKYSQEV